MRDEFAGETATTLELFHYETIQLKKACSLHLKSFLTDGRDELYEAGIKFYNAIDPMAERGLIATSRLFLLDSQTIYFPKICNIISGMRRSDKELIEKIKEIKTEFIKVKRESSEDFDRFWNVNHLHLDINGERYERQYNILHSCAGPLTMAHILSSIEQLANLFEEFDSNILKPILLEAEIIYA